MTGDVNETTTEVQDDGEAPEGEARGIVKELGELGPGAVITEAALARMLRRHQVTIKRAVQRGELPPAVRLLGGPVWTAGAIVAHLERRLAAAAKEAERDAKRISALRP